MTFVSIPLSLQRNVLEHRPLCVRVWVRACPFRKISLFSVFDVEGMTTTRMAMLKRHIPMLAIL